MTIDAFFGFLLNFLNTVLIPVFFVLGFLFAIWSIYQYFFLGWDKKDSREKGKKILVSVLIGFFFMFSFWGITNLLLDSTGFNNARRPDLPKLFDFRGTGSSNTDSGGDGPAGSSLPGSGDRDSANDCPADVNQGKISKNGNVCIAINEDNCGLCTPSSCLVRFNGTSDFSCEEVP